MDHELAGFCSRVSTAAAADVKAPLARQRRADRIVGEILDVVEADREAALEAACAGDPALRETVERLLRHCGTGEWLPGTRSRATPFWEALVEELSGEPLEPPTQVGPYRLLRELGRGGMAVVYLAEHADDPLHPTVAIKLLSRGVDSEEVVQRFRQERQILAALNHPCIARSFDGGLSEDGYPYFAMEYVAGEPINGYCAKRRLSLDQRLRLFCRVAEAVVYAERHLVVHRDLKPSNILVTDEEEVKLLDFGIAKVLDPLTAGYGGFDTRSWVRVMTPSYATPEQIQGKAVTLATDVYQLGLLLYELLTGRLPLQLSGLPPAEAERRICEEEPLAPSRALSEEVRSAAGAQAGPLARRRWRRLPGDLDSIVQMALRKEPERRYASAERLLSDVRRHLAGRPVAARRGKWGYRVATYLRRQAVGVAVAAGVLIMAGTFAGVHSWRLAEERRRSELEAEKARHVADFLTELFQSSDPERSGRDRITVRELLERGADRIDRELLEQPQIQAEMLTVLGDIYRSLGSYDRAEELLERGLKVRSQLPGGEPREIGSSLHSLGNVYLDQARFEEAETLHRRALRIWEEEEGSDAQLASSLHSLAELYLAQGRLEVAEEFLLQALEIRRSVATVDPADLARTLRSLGCLYAAQARFEEAESLLLRALAIWEERLGNDHLNVADVLNNLGKVYSDLGRYRESEALYRRTLAIREARLDAAHPDVAKALLNLANVQVRQERLVSAEPLLQRALAVWRQSLGAEHPAVSTAMNTLAAVYGMQGRYAEAEPLLRDLVERREKSLGPDHLHVSSSLQNLANVLWRVGAFPEAERLLERSLSIREAGLGADHPHLAEAHYLTGEVHLAQGRLEDARRSLERAAAVCEKRGSDHPCVGEVAPALAVVRARLGDWSSTEKLFAQALRVLAEQAGSEAESVAWVLLRQARLWAAAGRWEGAELPLERGLEIYEGRQRAGTLSLEGETGLAAAYVLAGELQRRSGDERIADSRCRQALGLTDLHPGSRVLSHLETHAKALLCLGRRAEARTLLRRLEKMGWRGFELSSDREGAAAVESAGA